MPLKLNINVNKKLGLPNYGSIGAGCGLELELDQSLLVSDPVGLQARVQQAYEACAEAVEDALTRYRPTDKISHHNGRPAGAKNGQSVPRIVMPLPATAKQLEYLRRLANQVPGLEESGLEGFVQQRCNKPTSALSRNEASQLIDELRQQVAEPSSGHGLPHDAEWQDVDPRQINNGYESANGYHPTNASPDGEMDSD